MTENAIIFSVFLIFAGAALLSTVALFTRQSLLVSYMLIGVILGPWGFKLIGDVSVVYKIGDIGIIFLLFLLGLNLHPQDLIHMFRKTFWIGFFSTIVFFLVGFLVSYLFGYHMLECVVIGAAVTFSSTIIGLKLLPTTVLHHQHTGELVISILLMQDLLAILVLLFIQIGADVNHINFWHIMSVILALPVLFIIAFVFVKFILMPLFTHFDRMHEYMFLLAIAWCLTMSEVSVLLGLSYEIGAFIAGVSIATSPISLYISESLKPIRDFFLVLFFFSIGASFDLHFFNVVILPTLILAVLLIILKPIVFYFLLHRLKETKKVAWEVGVRLGQTSCFSLLVAYLASRIGLISPSASYLVQATTIMTFVVSSYVVILFYPTPMAISDKLRRD